MLVWLGMSATTGWDGLGDLFVLLFARGPTGAGGLIGGLAAFYSGDAF